MRQLIKKFRLIYGLLEAADKPRLMFMFVVSLLNGLLGAAGIVAILPFIGLVSDPSILDSNKHIAMFTRTTGITTYSGTVVAFGLIALFLLVIGCVFSASETWYGIFFSSKKRLVLSARLLHNYLKTNALDFDRKNSAERAKSILSDVERVIISTLFSMLDLASEAIMSIFVVGLLLWVDWAVTLVVFAALVVSHLLINGLVSKPLTRYGSQHADLEARIYEYVLDALKLNKEIKLSGTHGFFVDRYARACDKLVHVSLRRNLINTIPKYLLEIVAFSIILSVAIYFCLVPGSESGSQPVTIIGMYAVAAYRLIPSMARIFRVVENIWYDTAILEDVVEAIKPIEEVELVNDGVRSLGESIALRNLCFDFGESSPFHMEALNLEFSVGKFSCIKGRTGCGKSTVLNLVSGLYKPISGAICADGVPLDAHHSVWWQRQIGLVPASVNLIAVSFYENIALGIEKEKIDRERVHDLCRMVELHETIDRLPSKYDSVYGSDGLAFSSGQIQKIAIARALYRNPSVLLLDESTDAFDLTTEKIVLERLKSIGGMTIIFVSHRPSVMECADQVIDLEECL